MKLEVNSEHIKEILVNYSGLMDTILPRLLVVSKRNDVVDAYSSIILSLLNTRLNPESRDYKVLNTIINKSQEMLLKPELELFIVKMAMVVRDVLSMMSITIDIEQLITDLNIVINNIAREGIMPIHAYMDIPVFNSFRKHIFALVKTDLSKDELLTYKKYIKTLVDWVETKPKEVRLAINTITSNVARKEVEFRKNTNYIVKTKQLLLDMVKDDYSDNTLTMLNQLLTHKNYWMVIPDEVIVLKLRRRLGRMTDRLINNLNENEYKLKGVKDVE